MKEPVTVTDVTLRDGLQEQPSVLAAAAKRDIALLLIAAGFRSLELTSFVRPQWVPQLADAEELLAELPARPGLARRVLVPNRKGMARALTTDADVVSLVISASTAHNEANLNRTTGESLAEVPALVDMARTAGRAVEGGVATAFGCPFRGTVTDGEVLAVVDAYLDAGADGVVLADTIGAATADAFTARLRMVVRHIGGPGRVGIHLHDPGSGVGTLCRIALDEGVRSFDVAVGGIGGCPFAPGAPGNARAEELVPVIERAGFATGIDVEKLPQIALALGLALGRSPVAPARTTGS